jgi:hypothetical protein
MPALTTDRRTLQRAGDVIDGPVAAGETIYAGALVMRNAAGLLRAGATATGCTGVGRAEHRVDNADGADAAATVRVMTGIFHFENSTGGDAVDQADIGAVCWIVDDQTVASTNGSGTRSRAGVVHRVDDGGVWVRLDEALARAT